VKIELLAAHASDLDVVNAARVSFATEHHVMEEGDDKLVAFLLRERHGTPFEHGYFKFRVEAPIFVFREWHRHRAGHSYNEMSGRYVELEKRFYQPDKIRIQHGKPGAYTYEEVDDEISKQLILASFESSWAYYQSLLHRGVAKEQARVVLPVGIYSQMIWSCNPRSLMHFIALRNHPRALKEIRDLARQAQVEMARVMPITHDAFVETGKVAP
jgi:thymidylate synthase (FAD)